MCKNSGFSLNGSQIISGKFVSQYASCSLIFNPLRSVINREQHEKHLYNQTSYYGKYRMYNHQNVHPNYLYKSG